MGYYATIGLAANLKENLDSFFIGNIFRWLTLARDRIHAESGNMSGESERHMVNFLNESISVATVSYTHLDVYKRQGESRPPVRREDDTDHVFDQQGWRARLPGRDGQHLSLIHI